MERRRFLIHRSWRAVLLLFLAALPLQAKSLYWKSLDVRARLDRNGNLHTIERQAIVFDGDWNGGERRFNVALGQDLHFHSIDRIDPKSGAHIPLQRGDLSVVDHYGWAKNQTLRWRSRRESDPPFAHTTLVYELDYTITNVLFPDGDGYRLDHAFAFADRGGVIEHFTLALDLAPEFRPRIATPLHWEVANIPPGETFGVRLPLRFTGAGAPASVSACASPLARRAVVLLLLIGAAIVGTAFFVREKARGSFDPLPAVTIDESWLQTNLFTMPPEVAGAAWDRSTGRAEVAGLIARLIHEGKLSSRLEREGSVFKRDVLHLELLVDRQQLHDYEQTLIAGLFFGGRTEVSTDEVREHYKQSGFDPASKIRAGVDRQVKRVLGTNRKARAESGPILSTAAIAVLFAVALALLVAAAVADLAILPVVILLVVPGVLLFFVPTVVLSAAFAKKASKAPASIFVVTAPLLVFGAILGAFALGAFERGMPLMLMPMLTFVHPGLTALLGLAVFFVALLSVALRVAMSAAESPESLVLRRKLVAAREFFRQQLALRDPRLRDEWYPYLLAFGLGANVDRWFRAYGANVATSGMATGSLRGGSSAPGSSQAGGSWSGGGGAFGGAGASGAWAAAAGSLAAGVSSASSGGGGGGGGFSSGGGGGGGW